MNKIKISTSFRRGFSLIEMFAAVAIMGVISFMAIPSITRMRADSERNLAISRAEAINLAMSTLLQTRGRYQAEVDWVSATSQQNMYALLRPYLAYAETNLSAVVPSGYSITLPASISSNLKATLKEGTVTIAY
jgi:prepilin-type N-terminal cleavage/methylation domain-containing protein